MFVEVKDDCLMSWADFRFSKTAVELNENTTRVFANGYRIENGKVLAPETSLDYRQKREGEYPSLGDMVDAFCKAEAEERGELERLIALRKDIKMKYPKA